MLPAALISMWWHLCTRYLYVDRNHPQGSSVVCVLLGGVRLFVTPWDRTISQHAKISCRRGGNPLQYYCLENSRDRGTWRATIYRIAESWTWLINTFTFIAWDSACAIMFSKHLKTQNCIKIQNHKIQKKSWNLLFPLLILHTLPHCNHPGWNREG